MPKGNRAGKYGTGNSKYNGFSITQNGKTENYIVVDGEVHFADGRDDNDALGNNQLSIIQQAYDVEGNTDGVIQRINRIGLASAHTLSDKAVLDLQKKRKKDRQQTAKQLAQGAYKRKKGVNRHRTYWSAM